MKHLFAVNCHHDCHPKDPRRSRLVDEERARSGLLAILVVILVDAISVVVAHIVATEVAGFFAQAVTEHSTF